MCCDEKKGTEKENWNDVDGSEDDYGVKEKEDDDKIKEDDKERIKYDNKEKEDDKKKKEDDDTHGAHIVQQTIKKPWTWVLSFD